MSMIRKFFEKKKIDQKFKKAGEGKTLAGSTSAESQKKKKTPESAKPASRSQPSDCAQRAGAAALARMEADEFKNKAPNWSLSAIRNQAKKELELEQQKDTAQAARPGPKEVVQECAPVLSVSGVYFKCPLIGPEILPKDAMQSRIKEFLYEQMGEEKALTSCLLIHTCNKDKEKVKIGIETISKYLRNIVDNPTEEKYRKIRLNNKVFKEKVTSLEGSLDFLLGAGFENQTVDVGEGNMEEFLVYPETGIENVEYLETLIDALKNAEPIRPQLDRNVRVLMPSQALARISLPNEFFNLSIDEIKREQDRRTEEVEQNSLLRTKAMRERDAIRELRKYRYSLMRIRFSDGIILQGTFSVNESLSKVHEFITDNLLDPCRGYQLLAPGGDKLTELESTLKELHLAPAALVTLLWEDGETTEANLNPELMALLQPIQA